MVHVARYVRKNVFMMLLLESIVCVLVTFSIFAHNLPAIIWSSVHFSIDKISFFAKKNAVDPL